MILERQRDAHLPGVSGALDQALAAPAPDFLFREFSVDDGPIPFSYLVSGQLRMTCDAPPSEEHPQMFRAQVGSHSNQLVYEANLRLTHLGHGIAEIVVGSDAVNLDAFSGSEALQFLATSLRPVERIAMRPLAVNLHAVITELFGDADEFRQGQGLAAIPTAEVGDAIESNFHKS